MKETVSRVLDPSADEMAPPNSMVFDLERAKQGDRLNRFAYSLKSPQNRERFRADARGYMSEFGMTEVEQQLVIDENWQGMLEAGASVYLLVKLIGAIGSNLVKAGLQMRGESLEAFKASRPLHGGVRSCVLHGEGSHGGVRSRISQGESSPCKMQDLTP